MAEQLLDTTQFSTRFKQMRGEGVAEQMGIYALLQPLAPRPVGDANLHCPPAESSPAPTHEQRGFSRLGDGRPLLDPSLQSSCRLAPDRNASLLFAFAEYLDGPIRQVETRDIEARELGEAQTRRIQQLHDGAITNDERVPGRNFEKPGHLIGVERFR